MIRIAFVAIAPTAALAYPTPSNPTPPSDPGAQVEANTATKSASLPFTGGDVAGLAAIGAGAVLAGAVVVRRSGNSLRLFMDAVAPGLLLAQGIGRWGNYFNQELYGKHTTLPWALEIHGKGALHEYHPTFLYEFVWDLLGVVVLVWVGRRFKIKPPGLFALYVAIYTAFRTYEETLRIDPSNYWEGHRINFWVSLGTFVLSVAFFVWWQFIRKEAGDRPEVRKARPIPKGPTMAVPRGRVRQRG